MKKLLCLFTSILISSFLFAAGSSSKMMPQLKIETLGASNPSYPDKMDFVTKPVSNSVKINDMNNEAGKYYLGLPSTWSEASKITLIDENGKTVINGDSAKVKARGNYTSCYPKKPLKISFKKKHSMLGLHNGNEYKDWLLLASYKDFSFHRDMTGSYIFKLMNDKYYSSDYKLVEVYINNQYWGVYLLAEPQSAERIGITEAKSGDGKNLTGYLFEYDHYADVREKYINGPVNKSIGKAEKDFVKIDNFGEIKDIFGNVINWGNPYYSVNSTIDDEKLAFFNSYLNNVWFICREAIEKKTYYKFNSTFTKIEKDTSVSSAEECISKIIDLDSLVNSYILCEIVCDPDLDYSSFYMDVDFAKNKKLTFEAPWDFDSALGHKNPSWEEGSYTTEGIKTLFATDKQGINKGNPWTILFGKAPWFQKRVSAQWKKMSDDKVKEKVIKMIDDISNSSVNAAAFDRNYKKWKNMNPTELAYELSKEALACKTQKETSEVLKKWINFRFATLDKEFAYSNSSSNQSDSISSSSYVKQSEFTAWTNGKEEKISDKVELSVTATKNGLQIIKKHNPEYKRINIYIHDMTTDTELAYMENVNQEGKKKGSFFEYPFVEKDHVYKITMGITKEDWSQYHSIETEVTAIGGKGNVYMIHDGYTYNKAKQTVTFKNLRSNFADVKDEVNYHIACLFGDAMWGSDCHYDNVWKIDNNSTISFYDINWGTGKTTPGTFLKNKSKVFIYAGYEFYIKDVKYKIILLDGQVY